MSDDFDSFDDDDEDFDLDDETDGLDEPSMGDSDDAEPARAQSAPAKPFDPDAKVPFFKNWIWWVSLVAAIPGGFLLASVVMMAANYGEQHSGAMWGVIAITGIVSFGITVLPLLLALGKFLGGDIVKTPTVAAVPAGAPVKQTDTFEDDDDDDDDGGFGDDDFEDDDGDFDDDDFE